MIINIIKSYRDTITICDQELLGKYFEEGEFQLDIKESFYNGEKKVEEEIIKIMQDMKKEDATFNIVGEKSIQTAIKAELISENNIKTIQDIPFSLVLM